MGESALHFNDDQLDELTRVLIDDADDTNSGYLTFEQLQNALSKHPGVIDNLTFRFDGVIIINNDLIHVNYVTLLKCCQLVSATE